MEAEAGKREVTRDRRPLCVITSYPTRTVLFNRAKVQAHSLRLFVSPFDFITSPLRRSINHEFPPFPSTRTIFVDAARVQPRKKKRKKGTDLQQDRKGSGVPKGLGLRSGDTQIFEGKK